MKYYILLAGLLSFKQQFSQEVVRFTNQVNLVPEGIAIHPKDGTIYISSIAKKKIIKLELNGASGNFISEGQDGFLEGLGMKVDTSRNCLWALSNIREQRQFTSRIYGFDLTSGRTIHQYSLSDTIPRLFNDLVISIEARLLITDTYSSSIYEYDPGRKVLDILIADTSIVQWPNGIDFLNDNCLVVATYGKGIVQVDIKSREVKSLSGFRDSALAYGLDGLVVNGNYLYGVYNAGSGGYATNTVVRYKLDETKSNIIAETVLDRGNAAFADPTTAAKFHNKLYVIANSHLDQYNKNKESIAGIEAALTPLTLLLYKL